MNCRDCGENHVTGGDGLRCSVKIASRHPDDCACRDCRMARWWLAEIAAGRG